MRADQESEQAVMDDDRLTTVEKIKTILIAMPDSYSRAGLEADIPAGGIYIHGYLPGGE